MKLHNIISDNHILIDLDAPTYLKAIEKLLDTLGDAMSDSVRSATLDFLAARESEIPTLVQPNVAIPHARIEKLEVPVFALGLSANGIPSPASDDIPIKFVALIVTPPSRNTFMLQMMSAVSRLFNAEERRNALLKLKTPQRVITYLKETEITIKKTLTVDDIMLLQYPTISPDDPLDRATELISKTKFRAIPVVDANGQLLGEITAQYVIRLALPDYIGIISNQNFLDSFDPFENYFVNERKRKVSEVMRLDCHRIKPETPILEVGQQLIEGGHRQIYVCRGQQLVGMIDVTAFINHCLQL